MPHTAKGTAKAAGSHFLCAQHQKYSVEDCAKSETRVGRGTSIAEPMPRGGVERLKRDIAPLSATQLEALLREAGADDG